MGNLAWIAVIGVIAIGFYFLLKGGKSSIEVLADELQANNPGMSHNEAIAQAAQIIAENAWESATHAEENAQPSAQTQQNVANSMANLQQKLQNWFSQAPPESQPDVAAVQASADNSSQAVQAATEQPGVAPQADALIAVEGTTGDAEAVAIEHPDEPAAGDVATAAEEVSEEQRKATEETWRNALADAEEDLVTAKAAAQEAKEAYDNQLAIASHHRPITLYEHTGYWGHHEHFDPYVFPEKEWSTLGWVHLQDVISSVKVNAPGWRVTLYEHEYFGGASLQMTASHPDLRQMPLGGGVDWWAGGVLMGLGGGKNWNDIASSIRVDNDEARIVLNAVRTTALGACTAARLVVERVLTITGQLIVLNIILAEAERVDKIARATREEFGEIEARLNEPVE